MVISVGGTMGPKSGPDSFLSNFKPTVNILGSRVHCSKFMLFICNLFRENP